MFDMRSPRAIRVDDMTEVVEAVFGKEWLWDEAFKYFGRDEMEPFLESLIRDYDLEFEDKWGA